ncbi:MAG: 4-hydroxy-tetrahydrodipicolinate synthase [Acidobacteriota bacterium]|jgi:4-hydroxy-tetrahydrodipicolinate synthase
MNTRSNFKLTGCGTAIVTPFQADESIDEAALRRLIEHQIEGGVDFIVACGTTGESVTLSESEQTRIVALTVEAVAGRVPVVAGAGGYNTREVIEKIRRYEALGIEAILSVTPYYNKPTQEGLYLHFEAIAEASRLPIILYNVPGRTGCNLEPATVVRLAQHPRIVAIKEASGNISQIAELAALVDPEFAIFSGDDALILPVAALGGVGVISVASNLIPREVSELTRLSISGQLDAARELNRRLTPVFKAMFIESNPIPVKAALAMNGMIEEIYRLPMCPLGEANRRRLEVVLQEAGVLSPVAVAA